jgi:hypothetical protein
LVGENPDTGSRFFIDKNTAPGQQSFFPAGFDIEVRKEYLYG